MTVDESILAAEEETRHRIHAATASSTTSGSGLGSTSTGYVLRAITAGNVLSFAIPASGAVSVGRGLDADIRVPLPDISRLHVKLEWIETETPRGGYERRLMVSDLGSRNGTTLGAEKIPAHERRVLRPSDPLYVGDAALVVHEGNTNDGPKRLVGIDAFEIAIQAQLRTWGKARSTSVGFGVCAIDVDTVEQHDDDDDAHAQTAGTWVELVSALLSTRDVIATISSSSVRLLLVDRTAEELDALALYLQRTLSTFSLARSVIMRTCPREGETLASLHLQTSARSKREALVASTTTMTAHETRRPTGPVIESVAMRQLYALVDEVASSPTSILILGETGVGKDVLARSVHDRSDRAAAPFVGLNCAALPESLLESELFGYERGAFTGAVAPKQGLLESAEGGTVFLDEVGEMPLATQAKLLRVLEEHKVLRLGGLKPKTVNFRLVAATNRNLHVEIAGGRFRADLFYRINGLAISIPPLRQRREEISTLAMHFAERAAATLARPIPLFAPETMSLFEEYPWPGNIRELRSVVERAVLLARRGPVLPEHLPEDVLRGASAIVAPPASSISERTTLTRLPALHFDDDEETPSAPIRALRAPSPSSANGSGRAISLKDEVERIERERIISALEEHGGNQTRAAESLGLTRRALIVRLERYGLPRPRKVRE